MAWQYHLTGWREIFDPDSGGNVWYPDIPEIGQFGAIDLRPSGARSGPAGLCLVATPEQVTGFKASAVKFGVGRSDVVPRGVATQIANRLGISVSASSVNDLLYEILTDHADDQVAGKWDRLKPTSGRKNSGFRRYEEIYLGELMDRRVHSQNLAGQNTVIIEDSFAHVAANENLEDEAPDVTNTPGNNWDNLANELEGDGSSHVRWDTAIGGAQMSQIDSGTSEAKVLAEFKSNHASNLESCYTVLRNKNMTSSENQNAATCFRFSMGSTQTATIVRKDGASGVTTIASQASVGYSANTWYVTGGRGDGSTLAMFWETPYTGTPADLLSATDSAYSTLTYMGIGGWKGTQNHLWNKFIVDDDPAASGGAVTFPTELIRRRQNTLLRM